MATENLITQYSHILKDILWIPLEPKLVDEFSGQTALQINGGGFAKALFEILKNDNVPSIVTLKFCSEGDNIPDAIELTNYYNRLLQVIPTDDRKMCKLKFPPSWKFLFGNSAPKGIF